MTTFYVLFFIHVQTRKIVLGGVTHFPNEAWVTQVTRNVTDTPNHTSLSM